MARNYHGMIAECLRTDLKEVRSAKASAERISTQRDSASLGRIKPARYGPTGAIDLRQGL